MSLRSDIIAALKAHDRGQDLDLIDFLVEQLTTDAPPAPVLVSVYEAAGPTAGGQTMILQGAHLVGATLVEFGKSDGTGPLTPATGLVVVNDVQVQCVAPALAANEYLCRVTTPQGVAVLNPAYTAVAPD